jgi:hypothetical protein
MERDKVNLNKHRSNSSVRLPSLERIQAINNSNTPHQTQSTIHILPPHVIHTDRNKSKTIMTTQSSVLDISRVDNS